MKFIAFTNSELIATALDHNKNVDTIFVDLEIIGKESRQRNTNSLISYHSEEDVKKLRSKIHSSKLGVRINPKNKDSGREIKQVINYGADVIMLPMFKRVQEVNEIIEIVGDQCSIDLLVETPQALKILNVLPLQKIRFLHFGINDLSIALGKEKMFEMFFNQEMIACTKYLSNKNISFGIGGIGAKGALPFDPKLILAANILLGSKRLILSRSFLSKIKELELNSCIKQTSILINELLQINQNLENFDDNIINDLVSELKFKLNINNDYESMDYYGSRKS